MLERCEISAKWKPESLKEREREAEAERLRLRLA